MPSSPSALPDAVARKAALRAEALAKRDALAADFRAEAAETIAAGAFPVALRPGTIVSSYMPIRSELSPLPLLKRLAESGAELALPTIAGRGRPLVMRAWAWGGPLVRGQWGIREPSADAPEVEPDILLVPLAAFDRRRYRVGYGAGYYDMTLAALRAKKSIVAVGLGFAAQEVEAVPAMPYDERLDFVLTEGGVVSSQDA